ncbi:unnamed protein product [Prunus brigantina]
MHRLQATKSQTNRIACKIKVMHLYLKKAQSLNVAVMVICNCQIRRTVVMKGLSMKVMDTVKRLKPDKAKMTYVANDEFNG